MSTETTAKTAAPTIFELEVARMVARNIGLVPIVEATPDV